VATTGLMRDARKHARRGKTRAARGASKVSKGISQKTTKNDTRRVSKKNTVDE
jgi:hypothetical protein